MLNDINDPLTAYVNVFRDRFKNVAENTFAELATEAKVDIEANHETCKQIYATEDSLSTVKTRLNRWYGVGLLLWLILIGCVIAFFCHASNIRHTRIHGNGNHCDYSHRSSLL